MGRYVAILLFTIPTLICSMTGQGYWPFFHYPLYSTIPQSDQVFQIWVRYSSTKEEQLRSPAVLWPVGPNGIDQKLKQVLYYGAGENEIRTVLRFFYERYKRLAQKEPGKFPAIDKIYLLQLKKIPWDSNQDPHLVYPLMRQEYPN